MGKTPEKEYEEINEEEIDDAAVKKAYDDKSKQLEEESQEEPAPSEKSKPSTSSEDVKSVKGEEEEEKEEKEEGQEDSKFVPRNRLNKEIEEKNKYQSQLERLQRQYPERVRINPQTGDLEIIEARKEEKEDDLTEDEKLLFDENQWKAIEKFASIRERNYQRRVEEQNNYFRQAKKHYDHACDEFPELKDPKSDFYKRADKLVRDKYTKWSQDRKSYYIPPEAQWLAALEADREIKRDERIKNEAEKEEKKNGPQHKFVESKSKKEIPRKKATEKDAEEMSRSELDAAMEEEFNEAKEKLGA